MSEVLSATASGTLTLNATASRSRSRTLRPTLSTTVTWTLPPPPTNTTTVSVSVSAELPVERVVLTPVVVVAASLQAITGVVSLFAGTDPTSASLSAMLSFLSCSGEPSWSEEDGQSFATWLAMLPLSPFYAWGPHWMVLGNLGLCVAGGVLHSAVVVAVALRARRRALSTTTTSDNTVDAGWRPHIVAAMATVRHPDISVRLLELFMTGVALGAVLLLCYRASNPPPHVEELAVPPAVVGALGVVCVALFVVLWVGVPRWALRAWWSGEVKPTKRTSRAAVWLWCVLGPLGTWHPPNALKRFGIFFAAMGGERVVAYRAMNASLTLLVAALSGTGVYHRDVCHVSLIYTTVLLLFAALLFAVTRPFRLPSENVLNPLKLLLLGAACAVKLTLTGNVELQVSSGISMCQTVVSLLRIAVSALLVYLTPRDVRIGNVDGVAAALSVGLGIILGTGDADAVLSTHNDERDSMDEEQPPLTNATLRSITEENDCLEGAQYCLSKDDDAPSEQWDTDLQAAYGTL